MAATAAVFLASALIYTSFSAGSDEKTAGQLHDNAIVGKQYTLAGTVAAHSVQHGADGVLWFSVVDPHRPVSVRVRYKGIIPDPFREGRGVLVKVTKEGTTFVGEKDSLTTKCPSKFQVAPPRGPAKSGSGMSSKQT
ncbi:MAG: Cytochrome c-type biosis protein CcmE-like protein [Conexibacter sp.]|nr:Cytochrome c-type biosis protein CcmE-like protein [Conexibacter sp.]